MAAPDETAPDPQDEETLFDGLAEQLERTRRLLTSHPEEAAEAVLSRIPGQSEVEARVAASFAAPGALAHPSRFLDAHRLAVRALEILHREGSRNPRVSRRFGPLRPFAQFGAEFVAEYIVKSYAANVVGSMQRLYLRREPQAARGTPERLALAQARVEIQRLAPGFAGGGVGLPTVIAGGAVVPILASASQYLGAIDFLARPVLIGLFVAMFILFGFLSSVLLAGAAVAHRRSELIMRRPLAALWEVIGRCGNPPTDDSALFATIALVLSALVWVLIPVGGVLVYLVS